MSWRWLWLLPLLLLTLLASLPASLLDSLLAARSDGRWRLSAASGTLWQGRGQLVAQQRDGALLPMSTLEWRWQPRLLWQGLLSWQMLCDGEAGSLAVGWRQWQLHKLALQMPVAALAEWQPSWRAAAPGGYLQWQVDDLQWRDGRWQGAARVQWRAASTTLSPLQPLGSYVLDVAGEGEGLALRLGTQSGPLQVQGSGAWRPGQAVHLAGSAHAGNESGQQQALLPLLHMLGRPDGDSVQWQLP